MSRASDMTEYARLGYDGNENPHLYSSPCWYAHSLGQYLHATGRTPPRDVRMGRGSRVHANDMTFNYQVSCSRKGIDRTGWERVS